MSSAALEAHLAEGLTTVCRCWAVTRRDGVTYGFTDHDMDLVFDGITFRATAMAVSPASLMDTAPQSSLRARVKAASLVPANTTNRKSPRRVMSICMLPILPDQQTVSPTGTVFS